MKKIWIITLIGGTIALSTGFGIKTLFIRANFEFEEVFPEHYSQQQHLKRKKAKPKIPSRDTETDESFQKFLDDKHPFSVLNYIPKDLLPIPSDFTANNAKQFLLREEA